MTKTFESEALVRFPDCDPFNHLNNARYLDYFMNAREDHLRRGMDFSLYDVARERGVGWVVGVNHIAYLRPAMLMDTVVIDSTLLAWREREVVVEMRMWNAAKTELKALLWSTFVHVNLRTGQIDPARRGARPALQAVREPAARPRDDLRPARRRPALSGMVVRPDPQ